MTFENLPSTNTPINASNLNTTINLTGFIQMYAGSTAPTGWLMCDGSAVSRTTYADLYAVIGTTYGTGDGSTTFNLPNMGGRSVIGAGKPSQNSSSTFGTITQEQMQNWDFPLGETSGEFKHTLTINEMPSHMHEMTWASGSSGTPKSVIEWTGNQTTHQKVATDYSGGDQAHNILQPYIVTNYIIKT